MKADRKFRRSYVGKILSWKTIPRSVANYLFQVHGGLWLRARENANWHKDGVTKVIIVTSGERGFITTESGEMLRVSGNEAESLEISDCTVPKRSENIHRQIP